VSYFTGEKGFVIGVDMVDEQLEVACKYRDIQRQRFGFKQCNVEFKKGYIEDLEELNIKDNSVDVVISNCVINLSSNKKKVFSEIFRVLKPGGELYFSDIFSLCRLPENIKNDPLLYGECLGGALYIEDFRRLLQEVGFLDYRLVSKRKVTLDDPHLQAKVGMIDFYSLTIRAFKLDDLEDVCEDYGQIGVYLGTIPMCPNQFILDNHHIFIANKPQLICGNTASMLTNTRYGKHFKVIGDRSTHYGRFECKPTLSELRGYNNTISSSCC
jgi:SAM-dependent methyltransferase